MMGGKPLSPRGRRLAALALLGLGLWLVWAGLVSPLIAAQDELNVRIASARGQLGRLETIIARTQASADIETADTANRTWAGASKPVIAAKVQKQVQSQATSSGITIVTVAPTQSAFAKDIDTAGLVVEGHGEIAAFVDLFAALERNRPILFVDHLVLRRYQGSTGPKPGERLPLSARFEIHAPYRPGGNS
ncbi:type II secretion system protein GspM [uncultured Roseibium sp.]|uniref:type II secretion system protein GspM n=1 Tax=uncultured Roseibium sp. TaxID=1936171 RepID=UPI003217FCBE